MAEEVLVQRSTRLEELCKEAEDKWPGSTLSDALNNLHHEVVRRLMNALREGLDVRELAIDLQLLADECRRVHRQANGPQKGKQKQKTRTLPQVGRLHIC